MSSNVKKLRGIFSIDSISVSVFNLIFSLFFLSTIYFVFLIFQSKFYFDGAYTVCKHLQLETFTYLASIRFVSIRFGVQLGIEYRYFLVSKISRIVLFRSESNRESNCRCLKMLGPSGINNAHNRFWNYNDNLDRTIHLCVKILIWSCLTRFEQFYFCFCFSNFNKN